MIKENFKEMSNAEIKLYIENLRNEFEGKKLKLKEICDEMDDIEHEYLNATRELEIRKNLYI